jgi:hypothetical protein
LATYDDHHVCNDDDDDEKGVTNVKKKIILKKKKQKDLDAQTSVLKSERLLSDEPICNVSAKVCCSLNCC